MWSFARPAAFLSPAPGLPIRPFALGLGLALACAATASDRLFPLEPYQAMGQPWLDDPSDRALLPGPFQARRAEAFQQCYLGPWDPAFVAKHLTPQVLSLEARVLANLRGDIADGTGFGRNLRPHSPGWLHRIERELPPPPDSGFHFQPGNRAVLTGNALVRLLPTMDLYMQHPDVVGQGFPFDNLQNSALWAGTPVYLLGETRDRAWCKVLSADCSGWVPAESLARAGAGFVRHWRRAVSRHGLVAAIASGTPVLDTRGRFRGHAFVGSVFPGRTAAGARPAILVPCRHADTHQAYSRPAFLAHGAGVPQPWPYTPGNAATLFRTLLGRPYGWGNTGFHNDCSAELKHFFTPFGLWLPRHSSGQKEAGRTIDLSAMALPERLAAVSGIGRPYLSLLWIQGHVMLYLGPLRGTEGFMTFQNLWAMRPKEPPDFRAIVGGSVLFPVLEQYPEAPGLMSLAGRSRLTVTQLDEDP